MIRIDDKENCCGCTACASACPVNAIAMMPDEEGFLYPQVDSARCIECGLCESTCPIINKQGKQYNEAIKGYILRYCDSHVVEMSTSGGAFTAFALAVLDNDGVIYGTGYDHNMCVVCKRATCSDDIAEMRGSKFVQSNLDGVFWNVKLDLQTGIIVLFVGTPCQVEGLLAFLGNKPENLICMDFVCRGVPSPDLWKNYVKTMENKYHSKMIGARFKHKTYGYHATTMRVEFENGKVYYGSGRIDPMMKAFVSELASRPSCGNCSFKTVHRKSDITMFDCYKFSQLTGLPDDNKGYSSLLVHSRKGAELLEQIQNRVVLHPVDAEQLVKANGIMVKNSAKPHRRRAEFYHYVKEHSIDDTIKQVEPVSWLDRVVEVSKFIVYKTGLILVVKKVRSFLRAKVE